MSNRASPARAAVAISLLAAAGSMPVAARASAPASTAASDRASAPVTLAPSTPEIFFPASTNSDANSDAHADAASADDIRDIRGPKGIFPFWQMAALLVGAALLAIGGFAAWRWARRRSIKAQQRFEIALQQLEGIRALMQPSSVREFSIAISDIVRQYIEVQFMVTATHRTTEEFLRDLLETSNAALAAHRNLLAEFLNQCDLAKFAGVSLSRQILESLQRSARSFVTESSKPPPAADAREAPPVHIKEARDSLPST